MAQDRGEGAGGPRPYGVVTVGDGDALAALFAASLSRRLLFLRTPKPPLLGHRFDLHIRLADRNQTVRLTAVVRFVAEPGAPRGPGCGIEVMETKETIAQRVRDVLGRLPQANSTPSTEPRLPLEVVFEDSTPHTTVTTPATSESVDDGTRKVLVVEDDADLQRVYLRMLQPAGFLVMTAKDGPAALELCQRHRFSLLVVDYLLPRLDGMKVVEKALETRKIPVIFSSAVMRDARVIARARALGVQWILEKPFRLEHLRKTFDEAILAANTLQD